MQSHFRKETKKVNRNEKFFVVFFKHLTIQQFLNVIYLLVHWFLA